MRKRHAAGKTRHLLRRYWVVYGRLSTYGVHRNGAARWVRVALLSLRCAEIINSLLNRKIIETMTDEQYRKAIDIHEDISDLYLFKESLEENKTNRLSYVWYDHENDGWALPDGSRGAAIQKILSKHDKMIRVEIDEEIERLIEEIKNV